MQSLKALHHIVASSAETTGAFNLGFDILNLHRPTMTFQEEHLRKELHLDHWMLPLVGLAQFEIERNV
jgi:hypothetical protein